MRSVDGERIASEANYAVFRTKLNELSTVFNVGRYLDTVVRTPAGLKFESRLVRLRQRDDPELDHLSDLAGGPARGRFDAGFSYGRHALLHAIAMPPMKPHPFAAPAAAGRAVLVALSFALSAAPAPAADPSRPASAPAGSQAALFAEASQLFRAGRHAAAYGRFVRLANEGDREAASIALVMHRHGAVLFGSVWDATTEELEYWSLLAQSAHRAEIEARLRLSPRAVNPGSVSGEAAYLAPETFRSDRRKKR